MGCLLAGLGLVASIAGFGCSGGGSGEGGPLEFVDAVIEELGELPLENAFLNSVITVEFNMPVDPDSVSAQTFRILQGPSFLEEARGRLAVEGRFVRFFPQLPHEPDLSDSGFAPGLMYRLVLRGLPDLNTIRSRRGRPLLTTRTLSFSTRETPPFYLDPVPGPPLVVAVLVDLNGDGRLEGDGLEATAEDEEFFDSEVLFDPSIPFVSSVHVGSSSLPAPNAPLSIGLLFSEPLLPASVLGDSDNDGIPDAFSIVDTTNPFPCGPPGSGRLCDRPITFETAFTQTREGSS